VFLLFFSSDDPLQSPCELSRGWKGRLPSLRAHGGGDGDGEGSVPLIQLLKAFSARLAAINVGGGAPKASPSLNSQSSRNANDAASADLGLIGLAVM
jgi:hypothetical protein